MKKFNDANAKVFVLLLLCMSLFSCNNDNDDFPKDYVGFKNLTQTVELEKGKEEMNMEIKLIAMEKSKKDRVLLLNASAMSGHEPIIKLTESKVIIKAGKKSVTTTIKILPGHLVLKKQNVILTCTPQWKEGKSSKMTILLKQQ